MTPRQFVPKEVGNGLWMLMHTRYGVLLYDLGWFSSREAAQIKAQEIERTARPVRGRITQDVDRTALN